MKIVEEAIARGDKNLTEYDSKQVLNAYSIPVTKEFIAKTLDEAKGYAVQIGYPVVLKGHSKPLPIKQKRT